MYSIHNIIGRQLLVIAMMFVFPALVSVAQAAKIKNDSRIPTVEELRLLPSYCPNTQIISTHYGRRQAPMGYDDQTKPYVNQYGTDFWHLHHYCFGLIDVARYYRITNRKEQTGKLEKSIREFDYVLKSIKPDSTLRPEVLVKRAQSLALLGRSGEAVATFKEAISLNANYSPAYAYLSDHYGDAGNTPLALSTLEDGLSRVPGDHALLRRYARLGGKKTFAVPQAVEPEDTRLPQQEPAEKEVESVPETDQSQSSTAPSVPAIGNETNPYCRFCP